HEGATAPCRDVSEGQANQIDVLIEWFAVAERIRSGGCRALCQNDDETRKRNRDDQSNITLRNMGQPDIGKPPGNSANHLDTAVTPIVPSACCNHADYSYERTRETRRKPLGSYDYKKDGQGDEDAANVNFRRVLGNRKKLRKEPVAHLGQAQHSVNLANRN